MKNKILLLIISFVCFLSCIKREKHEISSNEKIDNIKVIGNSSKTDQFIPDGYVILDSIPGNLNLDKFDDLILILRKADEEITVKTKPDTENRIFLILLGQKDDSYKLAIRNEHAIYGLDYVSWLGIDDPYEKTEINKNGSFTIKLSGGQIRAFEESYMFIYSSDDQDWLLSRTTQGHSSNNDDGWETIHSTSEEFGHITFSQFDINKIIRK